MLGVYLYVLETGGEVDHEEADGPAEYIPIVVQHGWTEGERDVFELEVYASHIHDEAASGTPPFFG